MIIEVENLRRVYCTSAIEVEALRGVSFAIRRGEFIAIIGPSGSGKSTLMNLLGCLDTPSSGSYRLDGIAVDELNKNQLAAVRNRKIGFVFQQFNLLARSSALENVALPLIYRGGLSRQQRNKLAYEALKVVGLTDRIHHRPSELSGGQQQRVAIARALVIQPSILLADEPTGALDTRTGAEIIELFHSLNQQGLTVMMVTHEPEIAAQAGRILTIRDGLLSSDHPQIYRGAA